MSIIASFNTAAQGVQQTSSATAQMIASAPPEQKAFLEAQEKVRKETELTKLITNMMEALKERNSAIINNIK
ncbi:hypothetical protein LY474_02370 [Myxococcus stipitatus]|uniref:hypothetical protein n=1 Tax=Myxococcus stipitatus TaxID=83455 RepID=UPI001F42EEC3|nr:hypothetical protein [Myxococcus stipitatus]MCE9666646.1 hypothetical protein [Myxococcus stipitatus]